MKSLSSLALIVAMGALLKVTGEKEGGGPVSAGPNSEKWTPNPKYDTTGDQGVTG
jgi:hypothetical protein